MESNNHFKQSWISSEVEHGNSDFISLLLVVGFTSCGLLGNLSLSVPQFPVCKMSIIVMQ